MFVAIVIINKHANIVSMFILQLKVRSKVLKFAQMVSDDQRNFKSNHIKSVKLVGH